MHITKRNDQIKDLFTTVLTDYGLSVDKDPLTSDIFDLEKKVNMGLKLIKQYNLGHNLKNKPPGKIGNLLNPRLEKLLKSHNVY